MNATIDRIDIVLAPYMHEVGDPHEALVLLLTDLGAWSAAIGIDFDKHAAEAKVRATRTLRAKAIYDARVAELNSLGLTLCPDWDMWCPTLVQVQSMEVISGTQLPLYEFLATDDDGRGLISTLTRRFDDADL